MSLDYCCLTQVIQQSCFTGAHRWERASTRTLCRPALAQMGQNHFNGRYAVISYTMQRRRDTRRNADQEGPLRSSLMSSFRFRMRPSLWEGSGGDRRTVATEHSTTIIASKVIGRTASCATKAPSRSAITGTIKLILESWYGCIRFKSQ